MWVPELLLPPKRIRMIGPKTAIFVPKYAFSTKNLDLLPQNDQIWPQIGIFGQFRPGHAGLFSALLVGRLVVVARGLYLARHLFTLWYLVLEHSFFKQGRIDFNAVNVF